MLRETPLFPGSPPIGPALPPDMGNTSSAGVSSGTSGSPEVMLAEVLQAQAHGAGAMPSSATTMAAARGGPAAECPISNTSNVLVYSYCCANVIPTLFPDMLE